MPLNGKLVCFASSFRCDGSRGGEETPNSSHAVLDGAEKTLCGRSGWETNEGPLVNDSIEGFTHTHEPDCLRCAAALAKRRNR